MSSTEERDEQHREDPPGEPLTGGQAALQQLLRLQSDIEEQGDRVAMAVKPLAEAIDGGESVSPEMMSHARAQILKAHLQLDDLAQVLDAIA